MDMPVEGGREVDGGPRDPDPPAPPPDPGGGGGGGFEETCRMSGLLLLEGNLRRLRGTVVFMLESSPRGRLVPATWLAGGEEAEKTRVTSPCADEASTGEEDGEVGVVGRWVQAMVGEAPAEP
jgi:hypothetical protein